jgi:hypothetical protein
MPVADSVRIRTEDRFVLALGAYRLGYIDLIGVPLWRPDQRAQAWAPVWELAARADVDAVIVHPKDTRQFPRVPEHLGRVRMRVLRDER